MPKSKISSKVFNRIPIVNTRYQLIVYEKLRLILDRLCCCFFILKLIHLSTRIIIKITIY